MKLLVSDLDGPILDVRARHHACYVSILRDHGLEWLPQHRYWRMKRRSTPLANVLTASRATAVLPSFPALWRARIEEPDLLATDVVQRGVDPLLRKWVHDGLPLVIATVRQHRERTFTQVRDLGLPELVPVIRVADQEGGAEAKARAVEDATRHVAPASIVWVGDTELDIAAARLIGCRVVAVSSGLRTATRLAEHRPDAIASSLRAIRLERVAQVGPSRLDPPPHDEVRPEHLDVHQPGLAKPG